MECRGDLDADHLTVRPFRGKEHDAPHPRAQIHERRARRRERQRIEQRFGFVANSIDGPTASGSSWPRKINASVVIPRAASKRWPARRPEIG